MRNRVLSLCMALALCLAFSQISVLAEKMPETMLPNTSDYVEIPETADVAAGNVNEVSEQKTAMAELAGNNDITTIVGQTIFLTCATYRDARVYKWSATNSSGGYVRYNSQSDIVYINCMEGNEYILNKSVQLRGLKAGTCTVKCDIMTLDNKSYSNSWNITVLPDSGSAGNDVTWSFLDSTLTIHGTGSMYNYQRTQGSTAPWLMCQSLIKSVVVRDGVISIGNYAFDSLDKVTSVKLGKDIKKIGEGSFAYCAALPSISLPDGIKTIPRIAFAQCVAMKEVTIPASVESIEYGAFYGCQLNTVKYGGSKRQWKRIQIGEENTALNIATIQYLGGDNSLTVDKNFDDRTSGTVTINCDNPTVGDFTITSEQPCIVLCNDGTNYVRIHAEKVSDGEYAFTLPDNYDEAAKIIVAIRYDLNGDGSVSSDDAMKILQISVGEQETDNIGLLIADINEDGQLTSTDALQVLRVCVGLRSVLW